MSDSELQPFATGKNLGADEAMRNPSTWGRRAWLVKGAASSADREPIGKPHAYHAVVRLRRNDWEIDLPSKDLENWVLLGDSNYNLPSQTAKRALNVTIGALIVPLSVMLARNDQGRLSALLITIPSAPRMLDAFRAARMTFDALQLDLCVSSRIPLMESAIMVTRDDQSERVLRYSVGYPIVDFNLALPHANNVIRRLLAPFADGISSRTPHYAFAINYALLEFLSGPWIGAMRRTFANRGISSLKRRYIFDEPEIPFLMPTLTGNPTRVRF